MYIRRANAPGLSGHAHNKLKWHAKGASVIAPSSMNALTLTPFECHLLLLRHQWQVWYHH